MVTLSERKIIVRLHAQKKKQDVIANIVGCSQQVVSYWIRRSKTGSLENKIRAGRPTKLTEKRLIKLKNIVKEKIEQKNASFGSITTKELRKVIQHEIGELYSIRHVERIMHKLGFSLITPRTMHTRHDQKAVDAFRDEFKKKSNRSIWAMN